MSVQRWDLQTAVDRLAYDFNEASGRLYMPDGVCTDMNGCIALFTTIDPKVRSILTFAGDKPDTAYYRNGATGEWEAMRPVNWSERFGKGPVPSFISPPATASPDTSPKPP